MPIRQTNLVIFNKIVDVITQEEECHFMDNLIKYISCNLQPTPCLTNNTCVTYRTKINHIFL